MEPFAAQGAETDQDQGDKITIVGGKTQSQDTFLNAFRSSLDTKKRNLAGWAKQLKVKPNNEKLRELIIHDQEDIRALEDGIRKI